MNSFILLTLFGTLYLSISVSSAYTAEHATALQSALLSNYSSKVRPSDKTVVEVLFGMMHITELNIVNQQLHVVGLLIVSWVDSRLTWNSDDFGEMDSTYILRSDVWSPPLMLNNAADEIKIMNDDTDLASVNIHLSSDGSSTWLAPANFVSQCTINIMFYPFDSQTCYLLVSSWLFSASELELIGSDSSVNTELYAEHGEWEVTKSTIKNMTRSLFGHQMSAIKFTIHLTRKYSYYLMNMILPVVVLAIMAPFVFMLPVESGEKIGYALTILLSLSVVMTLVSDNIPPTSTHICILSVYLLTTYIICSVETLITVVTCRIHDFHVKGLKMGPKLQSFTRTLARVTKSTKGIEDQSKEYTSQDKVSSNTSDIKIKGEEDLPKEIVKHQAWSNSENNIAEEDDVKEYSFEELAIFFDKFNFFAFIMMTIIVTLIFIVILRVGGAS